jgi:hypothetical protein
MKTVLRRCVLASACATAGLFVRATPRARAQPIDVQRARTLVVGTPGGRARTDRLDAARTGRVRESLPQAGLRTEWRSSLGELIEHAPLVDAGGVSYVVGARGEVSAVGPDGTERWHVTTGAMQSGPSTLLSDDTLVFVDAAGEAVAVRDGSVRWRLRFGRGDAARPAPLPLADGGVVVATTQDLAVLDAEGHERARTTLLEPTTSPLLSALGKVVAIGASGTVWTWTPGAPEATRGGAFGSPIADGAALADDHTLVAVSAAQTHLLAIDLAHPSAAMTRAVNPAGLLLGPPAMRGSTAHLLATTLTTDLAVAFDPSGSETLRTAIGNHPPPLAPDGGAAVLVAPPHTAPLVDADGTMAFATADGSIGVATAAGSELLSDACPAAPSAAVLVGAASRLPSLPPVVGLAPLESGAFVAACASGTLVAIRGGAGGGRDGGRR